VSGPNGAVKPSDNATFSGTDSPVITSGKVQCGGFIASGKYENLEGVPSQCRCFITGPNVRRVGASNQSALAVSVQAGTVQLTGNVSDAQNNNTNPATGSFKWISTNSSVATVNQSGLVTLLRKGQVTIELRYSRQANSSWAGATPSPTESTAAYATCDIQIGV
jgi:hypothetical protein